MAIICFEVQNVFLWAKPRHLLAQGEVFTNPTRVYTLVGLFYGTIKTTKSVRIDLIIDKEECLLI